MTFTLSKGGSSVEAEDYARSVIAAAAQDIIQYPHQWRVYVSNPDIATSPHFWSKVSPEYRVRVVQHAAKSLHSKLLSSISYDDNLRQGRDVISLSRIEDAIRDAISNQISLEEAGARITKNCPDDDNTPEDGSDLTRPTESVQVDIGPVNENKPSATTMAYAQAIGKDVAEDLMKSLRPNPRDFFPSLSDFRRYQITGQTPPGYLSVSQVAEICEGCADEMRKAHMPLISEDRFYTDIAKRVALDILHNGDAWSKALIDNNLTAQTFQKATPVGKQNRSGLVKKYLTDKRGRRTTVWVRPIKTEVEKHGHKISKVEHMEDINDPKYAVKRDYYVVHDENDDQVILDDDYGGGGHSDLSMAITLSHAKHHAKQKADAWTKELETRLVKLRSDLDKVVTVNIGDYDCRDALSDSVREYISDEGQSDEYDTSMRVLPKLTGKKWKWGDYFSVSRAEFLRKYLADDITVKCKNLHKQYKEKLRDLKKLNKQGIPIEDLVAELSSELTSKAEDLLKLSSDFIELWSSDISTAVSDTIISGLDKAGVFLGDVHDKQKTYGEVADAGEKEAIYKEHYEAHYDDYHAEHYDDYLAEEEARAEKETSETDAEDVEAYEERIRLAAKERIHLAVAEQAELATAKTLAEPYPTEFLFNVKDTLRGVFPIIMREELEKLSDKLEDDAVVNEVVDDNGIYIDEDPHAPPFDEKEQYDARHARIKQKRESVLSEMGVSLDEALKAVASGKSPSKKASVKKVSAKAATLKGADAKVAIDLGMQALPHLMSYLLPSTTKQYADKHGVSADKALEALHSNFALPLVRAQSSGKIPKPKAKPAKADKAAQDVLTHLLSGESLAYAAKQVGKTPDDVKTVMKQLFGLSSSVQKSQVRHTLSKATYFRGNNANL